MAYVTSSLARTVSDRINADVSFVTLVNCDTQKFYFCVGSHSIFLVSAGADSRIRQDWGETHVEEIDFEDIVEVNEDRDSTTLFEIVLADGKDCRLFESPMRHKLIDEIQIFFKTDMVLNDLQPGKFRRNKAVLDTALSMKREEEPFLKPPRGFRCEENGDYLWFTRKDYLSDVAWKGRLIGADGTILQVTLEEPCAIGVNERGTNTDPPLSTSTEDKLREISSVSDTEDSIMVASHLYVKKMNLNGDLAQWSGWESVMRTSVREGESIQTICVVILRRKYIPPTGETYQNIVISGLSPAMEPTKLTDDVVELVQSIADSITPTSQIFFYDDTLLQRRCNALALDSADYSWFERHFEITPSLENRAHVFFKSVANLLERAGMDIRANDLEQEAQLSEDPFEVVNEFDLEAFDLIGITTTSPTSAWETWRRRVSRYLAYITCFGGLHPGEIDIRTLVRGEKMATEKESYFVKQLLRKLLDYLLYLVPVSGEYSEEMLAEKFRDGVFDGSDVYFNNEVMIGLLEEGYLERVLEEYERMAYVEFLIFCLRQGGPMEVLKVVLDEVCGWCERVEVRQGMIERDIVLPLGQLLHISRDPSFTLRVGRVLVNLAAGSVEAKKVIVDKGCVSLALPHMFVKNDDLIRVFATMIFNLTNAERLEDRKGLALRVGQQDAANAPLVKLLKPRTMPGYTQPNGTIVALVSALWNLALVDLNRRDITRAGGLDILVSILNLPHSEMVLEKVCGAVMVMCHDNEEGKARVGELGGTQSLTVLLNSTNKKGLARNAVACLAMISTNTGNLRVMKNNGIQGALQRVAKTKDRQIEEFVKQIQSRLLMLSDDDDAGHAHASRT